MDRCWQTGKTLIQCNEYMLNNQIVCDVNFRVGLNCQLFRAHRYVLGSRSSVFYAMLYGPMADVAKEVEIPDIDADAFDCLLRYIYSESANLTGDNVLAVMHAANKYAMVHLENECIKFVMEHMSVDIVCAVLESAHCFNQGDLHTFCLDFISENPGAFESDSFSNLCKDCLEKILQKDNLITQEEDLYDRVSQWADYQCHRQGLDDTIENKRNLLGSCLYKIRFPIMQQKFFSENIACSGILTTQEIVDVFCEMSDMETSSSMFCKKHRTGSKQYICKRFSYDRTDIKWGCKSGRIEFYVDVQILIVGLVLYQRYTCDQENSIEIYAALEDSDNDELLTDVRKTIQTKSVEPTFELKFPRCIRVDPDVRYSVYVQKGSVASNWGDGGMASVVSENVNFYFLTTYKSEQTNRARGLIPGIIFVKQDCPT